jgi:hypothetical protein
VRLIQVFSYPATSIVAIEPSLRPGNAAIVRRGLGVEVADIEEVEDLALILVFPRAALDLNPRVPEEVTTLGI